MLIYLSHFYNNKTPGYGGAKEFSVKQLRSVCCGDSSSKLEMNLTNHVGTHIDLPSHFFEKGLRLQDFAPETWFSSKISLIDVECFEGELIEIDKVLDLVHMDSEVLLIRTGFEKFRQEEKYYLKNPGLSPSSGILLRQKRPNLKIVGFDFISLTSYMNREIGREAHKAFLNPESFGHPLLIIEDMKLSELKSIPSRLVISPLLIEDSDGVPVTVFAEVGV